MVNQGYTFGNCLVKMPNGNFKLACEATLKKDDSTWFRLIVSAHLSRPEDYLSIYQSGCNHNCLKCHSWNFTQNYKGSWVSTDEIAEITQNYESMVTVWEPRERATMWHATDLCYHCGFCVSKGVRSNFCPKKLNPKQIVLSPQGWGPARNIVAFTGGDLTCQPEFYAQATEKIKSLSQKMWVLIETNGYGLTPKNLEILASSGVDSFWLDIKAYDEKVYRELCGVSNKWILKTPEWIVDYGFTLEVLTLYIPNLVEKDQILKIAKLIHEVNPKIPFTILAFFPTYKLKNNRIPTLKEMVQTYLAVKEEVGLKNVKLGNCHIFAKTREEWNFLIRILGREVVG